MDDFNLGPHLAAVEASLLNAGLPAVKGEAAKNQHGQIVAPAIVIHIPAGGGLDGTAQHPDEDADWRFQLTCIGQVIDQALWLEEKAREAFQTFPVTVEGRSVQRVRRLVLPEVQRDNQVSPSLWYVTPLYAAMSFPDPVPPDDGS